MADQPSDTPIQYLVANLGKEGLDLRVDRRGLGPDVLTEATNVVYRSSSGVRTRDGHTQVPLRSPGLPIPDDSTLYTAFGTGEVAVTGGNQLLTGRWPHARGMVDGPNAPWAWTGDHLLSAPVKDNILPQSSPADSPRLFLPRLTEMVPAARKADQASNGLSALSVDSSTSDGLALLWVVTFNSVEGWHVRRKADGGLDTVVERWFGFDATGVTQIRALCVAGVHYVFVLDAERLRGWRWFQGSDNPTLIYDILVSESPVSAFELLAYRDDRPYLALANGTALTLRTLDTTVTGSPLYLTAPHTVNEMALAYAGTTLVWVTTNNLSTDIWAGGDGSAEQVLTSSTWYTDPTPTEFVDGVAAAVDPGGSRAWVWAGHSDEQRTKRYLMEPQFTIDEFGTHILASWTPADTYIPDSHPSSNGFMVGEVPCVWMSRRAFSSTITNAVGWLYMGATRHDVDGTFSVGAAAYHGYALTPSRIVLPAPVPLGTDGLTWAFAEATTAFKYESGLVTPVGASYPPYTLAGDGPATLLSLDFSETAALSQARMGGAVYLAGGQPHGFDGRSVYEAGFNGFPIVTSEVVESVTSTHSLDSGDLRQYRAYLVWRNAAGELMYSDSDIYQSVSPAVTAPQARRTLVLSYSCPASELYGRAWVEIYATTGGGGVAGATFYQVVSQGDGLYLYGGGGQTCTLVDSLSDANLQDGTHAIDPYNPSLTSPFNQAAAPWPACELVAAAGDRIWLAGGLVPPGTLTFTKLRSFGVAMERTDDFGLLEVSSAEDPVEWVSPVQDSVMVVAGGSVWAFGGSGPDNTGLGSFSAAVRVTGGVSGVARSVITDEGTWLLAASGCLLVGPGLSVTDVSAPVSAAMTAELAAGAVLHAEYDATNNEVRWYVNSGTVFVLDRNLPTPRWALWRLPRVVGGSLSNSLLVTADGRWLDTTPGHPTDAGQPIQAVVATSDLSVEAGTWVKFRHFLVSGKWLPSNTEGKLSVTAHYDGADYRSGLFWWLGPDNARPLNQWFGRAGSSTPDAQLRHRSRFSRQRGSSVRLRFTVTGCPALLSQVTVEVTQPNGPARLPTR